jgi:oxygen-independent coproporphyrinogen-3 oxidase
VPSDDYVSAIERELEIRAFDTPTASVDTIYLGGGTPSRLGPDAIARLIDVVARRFEPKRDAEITLEVNPDDVTRQAVNEWRTAGVNRVSLGVQSFDDNALTWMHRTHNATRVTAAAADLAAGGIENWSLDLIFALPASLGRDWARDVDRALQLSPTHISLYGLTVEQQTPIARWRDRGASVEGSEDAYEAEYLHAHNTLTASGYDHYEVSNFGRPSWWSKHNRGYWTGASYVGLGPSAHGYDGERRRWNEREYTSWIGRVGNGQDPVAGEEVLTAENRSAEQVYLGLRTSSGLTVQDHEREKLEPWIEAGWATSSADTVQLTPQGWLRLDALAASLTMLRSR